ncbi:MAG TPA: acetolactate synthase small subunit [Dehalococcoidia bacterium]|nr:acetolactate synthase small subunit [Dehalococcoidia bacterium]
MAALVHNKPGVLNRVASLFRRRGFNIESIAVGRTDDPRVSRMTIVVIGDDATVEQVRKQLDKVIDVVKIFDMTGDDLVARELALVRVKATAATRAEIVQTVNIFRGGVIDVASNSMIIEITGDEDKIDSLLNLLRGYGIKEVARTGRVAMSRGGTSGALKAEEQAKGE